MDNQTLVKAIIGSPVFQAATDQEKLRILEEIISTGEISKEQVYQIYQNSNLASPNLDVNYGKTLTNLPYEVFVNLIQAGQLEGRDLLQLCNSSAKLREYCDRSFTLNNGQQISQYIFRLALQSIGIDADAIITKYQARGRNLTPKDIYIYYTVGDGVRYDRLAAKLQQIVNIANDEADWRLRFPLNLGELLYYQSDYDFEFLGRAANEFDPNYLLFDHGKEAIYELSQYDNLDKVSDLDEMSKLSGKSLEELVGSIYEGYDFVRDKIGYQRTNDPPSGVKVTPEQLIQIIRHYPDYYRQYLIDNPYVEDKLASNILEQYNAVIHAMDNSDIDSELLSSIVLSGDDIAYLIKLHHRIVAGELKIDTPFLKDELL